MTKQNVQKLHHGLYKVYWKKSHGGGTSHAAVGSMTNGDRWIAPTNWTAEIGQSPAGCTQETWRAVEKMERLDQ